MDPQIAQVNQATDDVLASIEAALAAVPLTVDPALAWVEAHPGEVACHRGHTIAVDPARGIVVSAPTFAEAYAEADRLELGDEALLIRIPELPPGP